MNLDLNITYDDLSDDCKAKIKKLQKMLGKDNITITYPDVSKLVTPSDDWTRQITVPSYPQSGKVILCQASNIAEEDTQLVVKGSVENKKYGLVSDTSASKATAVSV